MMDNLGEMSDENGKPINEKNTKRKQQEKDRNKKKRKKRRIIEQERKQNEKKLRDAVADVQAENRALKIELLNAKKNHSKEMKKSKETSSIQYLAYANNMSE